MPGESDKWFVTSVVLVSTLLAVVALLLVYGFYQRGDPLPWMDTFSSAASGWKTETDASAEVGYHDGAMRILVNAADLSAWTWANRRFSSFRLIVDATQVSGPDDNEYGVQVRMQDNEQFYRFSISGDGYYQVIKRYPGGWELLSQEWVKSDAINLGAATNRIEVVCQGQWMTFIVNGVELIQVEDEDYYVGDIGLYAGSFADAGTGVEVQFDNLRVESP